MTVDAVLFDLDGTLCTYRRSSRELLASAFERAGVEPFFDADDYHARMGEYVEAAPTKAALRRRCFADLARERGRDPAVGERVAAVFATERDHSNVRPLEGARAALDALAADHRLALVTNGGPDMQDPKLDALDLRDYFEAVVYAGHETPTKPAVEPFERALADLGVAPERAVHVGDDLEQDVAGAHAAGVGSVWLPPDDAPDDPDPAPDYVAEAPAVLTDPPWRSARPRS